MTRKCSYKNVREDLDSLCNTLDSAGKKLAHINSIMLDIGVTLRARRRALNITAEQLAEKIGVERTYISKIENKGYIPSQAVMNKIADILNIKDPEWGIAEQLQKVVRKYKQLQSLVQAVKKIKK